MLQNDNSSNDAFGVLGNINYAYFMFVKHKNIKQTLNIHKATIIATITTLPLTTNTNTNTITSK